MRYFSAPAVFKTLINRITKPFMTLRQQQEYLVRNRNFPFLPYYCLHFQIATNRITKPFMTLRQQQEYLVCNRRFPFLPYYCVHSLIATNRIAKPNAANFNSKHKNGRHDFSCLPLIVSIVYPIKPHCKAKQSLYTATRFTRFSVLLCA